LWLILSSLNRKESSKIRSRCENTACDNNDLVERLLKCENKLEDCQGELQSWIDSLEELSEIENAFATDGKTKLDGKTILDVGTDCVKPLYIALKFKPDKIIGIDENLPSIASDLKLKSRLFTETKIGFYNCSLFEEETFGKIRRKEKIDTFDFILVSKTLHHLRTGECIAKERNEKHKHQKDETEACCIYRFGGQEIFKKLFELGKRVIVYEAFFPQEKDDDKERGRRGYFTMKEWKEIFENLLERYRVELITPLRCHLDKKGLESLTATLRQVDCICFYVERKNV